MKKAEHRYWVYILANATNLLYVALAGSCGFELRSTRANP
jgi:hypothetical protein